MNLRNVLRAYGLLRQLSDDESALLNILRALNDNDREQLVASMSDKPQKKSSKKAVGGGGKSSSKSTRGESLRQQISKPLKAFDDNDDTGKQVTEAQEIVGREVVEERCQFVRADGKPCLLLPDHNIHHMTTAREYHYFVAPTADTGKFDAQSAASGS